MKVENVVSKIIVLMIAFAIGLQASYSFAIDDVELSKEQVQVQKEFDLALRKQIVKLVDSDGNEKSFIINEEGDLANRVLDYNSNNVKLEDSIKTNETATYNHRKVPVVVENGDVITYSITIFNEGDIAGYASQIIDKLPEGLVLKGYEENGTTTVNYINGDVNFKYNYNPETNEIIFEKQNTKALEPFIGGDKLDSEEILVECKVVREPVNQNTYLTNIAYISKEYNSEIGAEVEEDRDSSSKNNPSQNIDLVLIGDKYIGYNGGDNNNGESIKNIDIDGSENDSYFPGKEDDDDFEIVVIKSAEFDLALKNYISQITTDGITRQVREAPQINTKNLAEGTKSSAEYDLDKKPVSVKQGDFITYTFTVYNEGGVAGYVNKITENIPTGVEFVYQKDDDGKTLISCDSQGKITEFEVDKETYELVANNSYWSIDPFYQNSQGESLKFDTYNGESTTSISCDIEGYVKNINKTNYLKSYNSLKDTDYNGEGLDRLNVTVVYRVSAENDSSVVIRNETAITEVTAPDGKTKQDDNETNFIDRDSKVTKWEGKDGENEYQDTEDYDNIILETHDDKELIKKEDLNLLKSLYYNIIKRGIF